MHDHLVALLFHAGPQRPNPSVRDAHLLRRLPLSDHAVPEPLQPIQSLSFLPAHCDSFHPSSLWAVKRNFPGVSPEFWGACSQPVYIQRVAVCQEWHRAIRLDWPGNLVGALKSGPVRHPGLEAESFALVHCQRHTAWLHATGCAKSECGTRLCVAGLRVRGQAQEKMRKLLVKVPLTA